MGAIREKRAPVNSFKTHLGPPLHAQKSPLPISIEKIEEQSNFATLFIIIHELIVKCPAHAIYS